MHCKHQSSHSASHNNSGLLDPSYHLVDPKATTTHSPGHSISSRSSTWTDETGEHDPDFRPFEPLGSPQIYPSSPSPRRRSLELPGGASTPNKSGRALSRDQLEPELYAAIRNHRLTLAKEDEARAQQHRCESRRPSFLGIRRCRSKNSFREQQPEAVFVDDNDDDSLAAYSPPPLPSLEIDSSSDDDQEEDEKNQPPQHHHDLKHHLAGLTLRVDLAVFRAKKRLRQRVGLAD